MGTRIFRVDLGEAARDFQTTATEPGLPMLDRPGANYQILSRWLGALVAEPEWTDDDSVNFFIREKERGRLDHVTCIPVTQKDLAGPLKEQLDSIGLLLKKAQPESTTEQLLHRIALDAYKRETAELETSDHHCYFFKWRRGSEPWQLVWVWGYQRADQQPSRSYICSNLDCRLLFARRPKTKLVCPDCQQIPQRTTASPSRSKSPMLVALLLLLLLAAGLIALLFPPQLIVSPNNWNGHPGETIDFAANENKWIFFNTDVSEQVLGTSNNEAIASFSDANTASAHKVGSTQATFKYQDHVATIPVQVTPEVPPEGIAVNPSRLELAIGDSVDLEVLAQYDGGKKTGPDLTEAAEFTITDSKIVSRDGATFEALAAGNTEIKVAYGTGDARQETTVPVVVKTFIFTVSPTTVELMAGQRDRLNIDTTSDAAITAKSSDTAVVTIIGDVADRAVNIAALAEGTTTITVTQDDQSQTIAVTVSTLQIESMRIEPSPLEVTVHQSKTFRVVGTTPGGAEVDLAAYQLKWNRLPVAQFAEVDRQTLSLRGHNPTTDTAPQKIEVEFENGKKTSVPVVVVAGESTDPLAGGEFLAHGPIPSRLKPVAGIVPGAGVTGTNITTPLVTPVGFGVIGPYNPQTGIPIIEGSAAGTIIGNGPWAPGSYITGIDGDSVLGLNPDLVTSRLATVAPGTMIDYLDAAGVAQHYAIPYPEIQIAQPVVLSSLEAIDQTTQGFRLKLDIGVLEAGSYRLLNETGEAVTGSQDVPARSRATFMTKAIPRNANNEYNFSVERTIGDTVRKFELVFEVREQAPTQPALDAGGTVPGISPPADTGPAKTVPETIDDAL